MRLPSTRQLATIERLLDREARVLRELLRVLGEPGRKARRAGRR